MLTLSSPSTARRRTVELRISFTVLPVEIIINESAIFHFSINFWIPGAGALVRRDGGLCERPNGGAGRGYLILALK
jgi:hypothetical protein